MKQAQSLVIGLVAIILLPWTLPAGDAAEPYGPQPAGGAEAKARHEAQLKACKGQADKLVLPGLVADRKERTVEVLAECTGLKGGDIAEFLLVDQSSERGYEALLWSYAKPSDIHRALEFIGLKAGAPFSPASYRFWPEGDKVIVTLRMQEGGSAPIERLVLDKGTGDTLPETGFVFSNSAKLPSREGKGEPRYGADVDDARSVASIYNEPCTVLDLPRQVNKSEVYGQQVANPETGLKGGDLVTLVMTPGDPEGVLRARHWILSVEPAASSNGMAFNLGEAGKKVLHQETALTPMLERLVALGKGEVPVYLALAFGKKVPIREVRKVCLMIGMMEAMKTLRFDPPTQGQLYYRALVPDKNWMTPAGRPSLSWELHLSRQTNGIAGRLVWHEQAWARDQSAPSYKPITLQIATPRAAGDRLEADKVWLESAGVLLVYADPGVDYGDILHWAEPALKRGKPVYVFVQE